MEDFSFWKWYTETAEKAGALISYTIAGLMLGTTRQYIQNLVYREKLPTYEYDGMKFIGMNDLQKVIIKRQETILKNPSLKRITYKSAKQEKDEDEKKFQQDLTDFLESDIGKEWLNNNWPPKEN